MEKYTVLTYNTGGYELLHEIKEKSPNAEYLYITDDPNIKSETWRVIYEPNLSGGTFDKCFQIRYNPWKYASTDIVLRVDGSMGLDRSFDNIIQAFINGEYDICVTSHPTRQNIFDEYVAWIKHRKYPIEHAQKIVDFLVKTENYNVKAEDGLFQYNFMIQRKNRFNETLNSLTYSFLKYLAPEDDTIERMDQTIGTFIINKYFGHGKIMFLSTTNLMNQGYFSWYLHGTDTPMVPGEDVQPKFQGKTVDFSLF